MNRPAAYIVLALTMVLIYGSAFLGFFISTGDYSLTESVIIFSLLFNLAVFVGVSVLFVYFYYGGKILSRLYLKRDGIFRAILYGSLFAIAFMIISGAALVLVGYDEENPLAEEIGDNLSLFSVILIPVLSAVSEEFFFRGVIHMHLEKKVGFLWAVMVSSLLFAFAHLEYGTVIQIVAPFMFGVILGFLMHKTRNIMAPIAAHFTYNFIGLLAVYLT